MRNKFLIIIPIIVVTAIGIVVYGGNIISDAADYEIIGVGEQPFYSNTIKLDDTLVNVQIANTDVKRNRGLMFEEPLPYDQGMLFIYEESGNYSFWMHNVKFALDILWFDDKGNAVHIKQNIPPCTTEPEHCTVYDPGTEALYVFEATAGFVEMFGITDDSSFSWIVDKTS
ncbi:MAG: DUF192 domain-containing protein [Nitrosopumilus sp.]|nr:DUF192 domain-containing protein [Nitrosopumilus sp.]MDH3853146.1 DUF192 domain-containing protein [Nitrosopumilus sp.]